MARVTLAIAAKRQIKPFPATKCTKHGPIHVQRRRTLRSTAIACQHICRCIAPSKPNERRNKNHFSSISTCACLTTNAKCSNKISLLHAYICLKTKKKCRNFVIDVCAETKSSDNIFVADLARRKGSIKVVDGIGSKERKKQKGIFSTTGPLMDTYSFRAFWPMSDHAYQSILLPSFGR